MEDQFNVTDGRTVALRQLKNVSIPVSNPCSLRPSFNWLISFHFDFGKANKHLKFKTVFYFLNLYQIQPEPDSLKKLQFRVYITEVP